MKIESVTQYLWRYVGVALAFGLFSPLAQAQPPSVSVPPRSVAGFEEPLVATARDASSEEQALSQAIARFDPGNIEGVVEFDRFLAKYPDSAWRLSIQTNLGLWYYREGYFSRAIAAWEDAWTVGRALPEPSVQARALTDRAVGELIRMHARLGHAERLKQLMAAVEGRALSGSATELVAGAKQGLWMMDNDPGVAYLCGPNALRRLSLLTKSSSAPEVKLLERYRSSPRGVSLAQVGELAKAAKLDYTPVFRSGKAPIPVPSVVHWKVSHYAAIVGEKDGRYHIQDPTFGTDLWVSRDAVEKESTGFFLISNSTPRAGWRDVTVAEGNEVYGMGFTNAGDPNATRPTDPTVRPPCGNGGMCGTNAHSLNVSLNLTDTPVGYRPAVGPAALVQLTYNQREARQPTIPTFGNVGPKWTHNWLAYVVDVPNRPGISVMSYVRGGGAYDETGFSGNSGLFAPEPSDYSILRIVSVDPIRYEHRFKDGSVEVYATPDGATFYPRRVFLTQVLDPAGNAVSLTYDASKRLTKLTDAVGRNTTLSYASSTFPLQTTKITDPFGRFASISYDSSGRLKSITDVLGLVSTMTYDSGNFITRLTTPYGASNFAYTESGPDRTLDMTDPLGFTEHVEAKQSAPGMPYSDPRGMPVGMADDNQYLYYRNTFYWDKHAYNLAPGDYTKARIQHWYHDLVNFSYSSSAMASSQQPLEGRQWYRTPNDNGLTSGTFNQPWQVGKVLDDGSSQVVSVLYNKSGNVASLTDPAGRYTQYTYALGGIDVTRVRQRSPSGTFYTIAQYTYNDQHLPLNSIDAAGQLTLYTYNAAGQLTSQTDALGKTWGYEYDAFGQLTRVVNPGNTTQVSMTYDSFGRVATRTDSQGRSTSFAYDALDRLTVATYPDATTEEATYDKLDIASSKDRLNRLTSYAYDANRRLTSTTDPLQRSVSFTYTRSGDLLSMTDAKNRVTSWQRDLQGRVVAKVFANATQETFNWETYGGRLKSQVNALGRTRTFTYRRDDLLSGISYTGGPIASPSVSFAYDPAFRRLSSMTDGTGTTTYQYGAIGALGALQLSREDGPNTNDDIDYSYDALGRLSQRSVAGSVESVTYDALGRVISGQNALGALSYAYLGQTEQLASQGIGANARTDFTYDANSADRRLKSIANLGTRGYQYTSKANGLITKITDTTLGAPPVTRTWTPTYDAADRLTSIALSTPETYQYAYDAADNITSSTTPSGTTAATYGSTNQLASLGGATVLTDSAGHVTEDALRTYQWDAAGRLVTINYKTQAGKKSEFRYDGLGRRSAIVETSGSTVTETRLLWCGSTLCQARDSADTVTRRYFAMGEFRPVTASKYYYNRDHLGSVRDVTSAGGGTLLGSFDYDPYGNLKATTGNATTTDFRYAGMYFHAASGLYLTLHRAYAPNASRWLSRDPIGETGGLNLYGYVNGDPLNYVDPHGEFAWIAAGAIIGAGVNVGITYFANGGNVTGQQLLAAAASGAISGAIGAAAGPLGGTIARGLLGAASNGFGAAVASGAISAAGSAAGQAAANQIDPCNASNPLNAALWGGIGGGLAKGLVPTRNLNTWRQASYFGPSTFSGLFGSSNAAANLGSFAGASAVGGASNFPAMSPF